MSTPRHFDELAKLVVRPSDTDPESLASWLVDRQQTVKRLQAIDASGWEESERQRFRRAIDQVLKEDEVLVQDLRKQQRALQEQLSSSLKNKAALRGYRLDPAVQGRHRGVKA